MKDRGGVLELAVFTDGCRLPIAFNTGSWDAQGRDGALRQQFAQFFSDRHQLRQVVHKFSGVGIFNYCNSRGASGWRINGAFHFRARLFEKRRNLANVGFHRNPSSPLISEAFRPPTRA